MEVIVPFKKIGGVAGRKYIQFKSKRAGYGSFHQKVPVFIDSSRYQVKTISSLEELRQACRLRYKVFIREGLKKRKAMGLDIDKFDFISDHLVVIEKSSDKIVGTYRLISSLFSQEFYSQSEFVLDEFLQEPGIKLELGRACIEIEHRNGAVLAMLWKGIHEYMTLTDSRFLFGCASVKTVDVQEISKVYHALHAQGLVSDRFNIRPTEPYTVQGLEKIGSSALQVSVEEARQFVPPLLRSYFKAGAKVMGEPAIDWDFQCIDLLTILEKDLLDGSYSRKFSTR